MPITKPSHLATRALAALVVAVVMLVAASRGEAVTMTKTAPAQVLYGTSSPVTVTVHGAPTDPYLYNLTIRDVLPPGVSYEPGSSSPEPDQIIPVAGGSTVIVWRNLSDLSPASTFRFTYSVAHDIATVPLGGAYVNNAQALLNSQPRIVPTVNATTGAPSAFTHQAVASATTQTSGIRIRKSEPSPEGEILRGVHNHPTTYTLTVRGNAVAADTDVVVDDYIPANLEFLGCGGIDNTETGVVEYPGAPRLDASGTTPGCVMPGLVETINADPDGAGPLPAGVYTHVRWTSAQVPALATLGVNAVVTIPYRVGVPMRSNTASWPGATPASDGAQAANLDNNTGPLTFDEQPILNGATASGTYSGSPTQTVTDHTTLLRTAEDLRILKTAPAGLVTNGEVVPFTITLDGSEYVTSSGLEVTDTLPDGLCPLGAVPPLPDAECHLAGQAPTLPYTSVTEDANGDFTIRWNIDSLAADGTNIITFPTRVRRYYQEDFADVLTSPVLASDGLVNTVRVEATANPTIGGQSVAVTDESAATVSTGAPTIDKKVSNAANPLTCAGATYVDDVAAGAFRPGDRVCFLLRASFPSAMFTNNVSISDFLPAGMVYESATPTPNNTSTGWTMTTSTVGVVQWTRPTSVPDTGQVFEMWVSAIVTDPSARTEGEIAGNLMKLSYANTPTQTFPLRDRVDMVMTEPVVRLVKGVMRVNGTLIMPAGPNSPTVPNVRGGDVVEFRVDPSNTSATPVVNAQIWDNLPPGYMCADLIAPIPTPPTGSVTCVDQAANGRIIWTGLVIPADTAPGDLTLTYRLAVPETYGPSLRMTNTAGVRQFEVATNRGGTYTYIPLNNIDPSQPTSAGAIPAADRVNRGVTDPARDTAAVTYSAASLTKTRVSTSVVDVPGNNGSTQATPGETVAYRMTLTIPDGETVYDGLLSDPIRLGQELVGTPTATLNGGPLPAGFDLTTTGTAPSETLRLQFPPTYVNATGSGSDVFVVDFSVRVRADAGTGVVNSGAMTYRQTPTTATITTLNSSTITTPVVRPSLTLTKSSDNVGGIIAPDGYVTYSLSVTNASAASGASTAHDVVLTDVLPQGAVPVAGTAPVTGDGAPVPCPTTPNPTNGVPAAACPAAPLDSATLSLPRTLTWPTTTILPGQTVTVRYRVRYPAENLPDVNLVNTARVDYSSMAGTATGEQSFSTTASHTLTWNRPSIVKTADRSTQVVGGLVRYAATVTIPGGVHFNDAVVVDRVPDGLQFVRYDSFACVGCDVPMPASPIPPTTDPDGSTRIGGWLDDVPAQATPRTLTIQYTARVAPTFTGTGTPADGTPVVRDVTLTNAAQIQWSLTDDTDEQPAAAPAPVVPPSATMTAISTADVRVVEPRLIMNKHVDCDGADPGPVDTDSDACTTTPGVDRYTYTISIQNTGNATAHDVQVTDLIPSTLTDVRMETLPSEVSVVDDTAPSLEWAIDELPAGTLTVITYSARWVDSAQLGPGSTAVNDAAVPHYFAAPRSERELVPAGTYRDHTDGGSDRVTLSMVFPEVTVAKTVRGGAETGDAQVNQPFGWTIVLANDSSADAFRAIVRDTLPEGWEYVAGSTSYSVDTVPAAGGTAEPTVSGRDLTWSTGLRIPAGRKLTLTFEARPTSSVLDDPAPRTYTNTASAAVEDGTGATGAGTPIRPYAPGTDTATATVVLPAPAIAKTPDAQPVSAGDVDVPFSILASNFTGGVPLRNVVITDTLPTGTTYVTGSVAVESCAPGPVCVAGPPPAGFQEGVEGRTVTFRLPTIAAGAGWRITYRVNVTRPLANGTVLTNTARMTADEIPGTTVVEDTGSLRVGSAPAWFGAGPATTTKTSVPATGSVVAPGDLVTYSLRYANSGNEDATGVVLTDVVPAETSYVAGSASSAGSAAVAYRVAGVFQATEPADPTRVEAIRWTIPVVEVDTDGVQTFSVRVRGPVDTGTEFTNLGGIASDQTPTPVSFGPDPGDHGVPTRHSVRSAPNLSLAKSVDHRVLTLTRSPNDLVYRLVLSNTGDMDATGVVIEDGVPDGVSLQTIDAGGAAVTCSTDPGTPGHTFGTCPADLTTVTRVRWTFPRVVARDTVPVTVPQPDRVVGMTVRVPLPGVDGTVIGNRADLVSDQTAPATSNPVTTTVAAAPALLVAKSASAAEVAPGDAITYNVVMRNSGTEVATNARLTDVIPAGTVYVAGSASGTVAYRVAGVWTAIEPTDATSVEALRWQVGTLDLDETAAASFIVRVPSGTSRSTTRVANTARFESREADRASNDVVTAVVHPVDPTIAAPPASPLVTPAPASPAPQPPAAAEPPAGSVSAPVRLRLVKRGPTRLRNGQVGTWRMTITNTGRVPATNVVVVDTFPRGLTYRAIGNRGRLVKGVARWSIPRLDPGRSRTVWVRLRVTPTARGVLTNRAVARAGNSRVVLRSSARVRVSGTVRRPGKVAVTG